MDKKNSLLMANMMSSSGGGEVEFKTYCYATDNAYIQTDISANNDYKIKIVGIAKVSSFYQLTPSPILDGCHSVSGNITGTFAKLSCNYYGSGAVSVILRSANNQTSYDSSYKDDVQIGSSNGQITQPNFSNRLNHTIPYNKNFYIFYSQDDNLYSNDKIALSLIEIKDQNDNLLHELKPAIVNGESGMYDTVTETFYGNANSVGSLVCE